jgi:hypothetical protein
VGWLLDRILGWLTKAILGAFDAVFGVIAHGLLISPDVTTLPQVQTLAGRSVLVVQAVFVLAFVAAGVLIMVAGDQEGTRYTVKELLPRLVVAFVAAHFSQLVCGQAIGFANGLTVSLTSDSVDQAGALTAIRTYVTSAASNPASQLLLVVLVAVIVVLLAATTFGMVARFAVLLILAAVAPLALACHALPQTDPAARLWWRSFTGCLAVPVLQALALQAGRAVLLDPAQTAPALGLPDPGGLLNLLVVVVLLWTTLRIPGLVARYAATPRRTGFAGQVVRVVLIQRGLRAIGLRGRGGRP